MSEELAISLRGVSKCFKRYDRPVDRLKELLIPGKSRAQEFWALRDIDLDVPKGQTLGIVGRNGSGKSTLLQIIAGTLTPTTGTVQVNGRVSALLELGSGFNPEFTGRQNVFFNGQLLGLTKAEVEERFDEIAAFADIGDFIDQPVKTYSSGMFVRLAFAVAINVSPDILIVDEALAVGDEVFQRKCISKISFLCGSGVTTLFVSHSASLVINLCSKSILFDHGQSQFEGSPDDTINQYHQLIYSGKNEDSEIVNSKQIKSKSIKNITIKTDSDKESSNPNSISSSAIYYRSLGAFIQNIELLDLSDNPVNLLETHQKYKYKYDIRFDKDCTDVTFGMHIKNIQGLELGGASSHLFGDSIGLVKAGEIYTAEYLFVCRLREGTYFFNAGVQSLQKNEFLHRIVDALMFKVKASTHLYSGGIVDFSVTPSLRSN